jgi:hypothetical protein
MRSFWVRNGNQTQGPEGYDPHEVQERIENCVENIETFAKKHDSSDGKEVENKVPKQAYDVA